MLSHNRTKCIHPMQKLPPSCWSFAMYHAFSLLVDAVGILSVDGMVGWNSVLICFWGMMKSKYSLQIFMLALYLITELLQLQLCTLNLFQCMPYCKLVKGNLTILQSSKTSIKFCRLFFFLIQLPSGKCEQCDSAADEEKSTAVTTVH